jgi:hypothetical protein
MDEGDVVKMIMEIDMRFENLETNSNKHYEAFDEVKAELFNVQTMCIIFLYST